MDWERFGSNRHVGTAKVTVQELIDKAGKDVSINVLRPASTKLLLGKDAEPCILNLFWEFLSGPLQQDVRTVDGRQEEDDERRETNGAATWLRSNGDERTRGSEWNGRGENGERRNRGHTDEGRKGRGRGKENGKGRSPEPRQISIESDFVYHDVDRMETVGTSSNFRNRPSSNPVELRSPRERTARGAHIRLASQRNPFCCCWCFQDSVPNDEPARQCCASSIHICLPLNYILTHCVHTPQFWRPSQGMDAQCPCQMVITLKGGGIAGRGQPEFQKQGGNNRCLCMHIELDSTQTFLASPQTNM